MELRLDFRLGFKVGLRLEFKLGFNVLPNLSSKLGFSSGLTLRFSLGFSLRFVRGSSCHKLVTASFVTSGEPIYWRTNPKML